MAGLALKRGLEERSAEPGALQAVGAVDSGVPALDGRCLVLPDLPLPGLSTSSAQAFVAVDRKDPSQQLYALITDPLIPFRLNLTKYARDLGDASVVQLMQWGSIDWPKTARRETFLLLQRPPGEPLMPSIDAEIQPMKVPGIAKYLMKPMAELLFELAGLRLTHRNIRPTNLFRAGAEEPVVAGEFYSAPPGFNQPSVFEPIERAMCSPAGRGPGEISDDLYALGVTALFLALGTNPVAHLDDKTLLAKRAERGSYTALTANLKPPGELAPVIRSLMHDSPHDRWTVEDLLEWVNHGVASQAKPMIDVRADRGFEFANGRYHTRREVALAFSQNWPAAVAAVQGDTVERWAERSIKDRDLSQQIGACRRSDGKGPRMIGDDLLVARTIITLDPEGPLRFRDVNVMPDGLGALTASVAVDPDMAATFTEMMSSQLMEFWLEKQSRPGLAASVGKSDSEKILVYLETPGAGFAIERCVYEMNKGIACQSPRFKHVSAMRIRELMEALDTEARKGGPQLDRHVAAFLGARYSGSIDRELTEFGSASGDEKALVAQLKIFAAVQFKHGPPELSNLAAMFLGHIDSLLSPYHSAALRQRLRRAAERAAPAGKLAELLGIVRSSKMLRADEKGFAQAKNHYRVLERQVRIQEAALDRTSERSLVLGRKVAAYVSSGVGATVVVLMVLAGLA